MDFKFNEEQTVSYRSRAQESWVLTKLRRLSDGKINTQQQANVILLSIAIFLMVIAFFLLQGSDSEAQPLTQQQINEIISNQQPDNAPRR